MILLKTNLCSTFPFHDNNCVDTNDTINEVLTGKITDKQVTFFIAKNHSHTLFIFGNRKSRRLI